MKVTYTIATTILIILVNINQSVADDFDIIFNRMYTKSLTNPSKSSVDAITALLNVDGSFSDLNYTQTATDLTLHLTRINTLASAYKYVGNTYQNDVNIKNKYFTSLNFWITKNHQPNNWWFRHIAYPKTTWPGVILMSTELKAENSTLFNKVIAYLRWAYLLNNYMEGANGADKIAGAFPASVLIKSDTEMQKYKTQIMNLIVIQNEGEGIEADQMFAQHSGTGRQLYANYEIEYMKSILENLAFVNGTVYDVPESKIRILEDHYIQAVQWYVYQNRIDPAQTGRKPSSTSGYGGTKNNTNNLLTLNGPQSAEMGIVYDRINKGVAANSKLIGNRSFWRFDYMIHRRANYYVSTRLSSTRCVGMESGNGEGTTNYYGGAGLNFIMRTGKEYDSPFFSIFNYRQWPGITAEQDNASLPLVDWGAGGLNGNAFAGGVSDGCYGVHGFIYSKRNVNAYKSWFYFDKEIIALGSGITQANGSAEVFTTINQTLQKTTISYYKNATSTNITTGSGTTSVNNPDWILHDSIGYINLQPNANFKISSDTRSTTNIFTAGINHGINPSNASYAYLIYPNTSTGTLINYKANLPIQIISNTKSIQAVYHQHLKITQAIFYTAGSLTLSDGKILSVNIPSAIMLKDTNGTYQITVANPLCESSNPANIIITLNTPLSGNAVNWNGTLSTIIFALPQGDFAGQSVSKIFYQGDCAPVFSSADDGNIAENTIDNNLNTRWSALGDGQSITFCLGTIKTINRVDIAFFNGDTRTSTFDIQVSSDGISWTNAALGLVSSGKSTVLEPFTFTPQTGKYVKIIGHGNSSNLWNSYTEVSFPANVSPTTAIIAPSNNSSFAPGASITIDAMASDIDGTITKVEFYNGSSYIGADATSPYSFIWNNVAEGAYKISVKAYDNAGGVKYASIQITVASITAIEPTMLSNYIYPNPAKEYLYTNEEVEKLEIFDDIGNVYIISSKNKIDLSNLKSGIYIVKIFLKTNTVYNSKIAIIK